MRRLIRRAAAGLRAVWLRFLAAQAERELQLLNTHAMRMAAERAELCERRGRLALALLQVEDLR